MKLKTGFITRTAVLIALTVVFQLIGLYLPAAMGTGKQFIVGSLVNVCLFVAAAVLGLWGGLIVAVVSPLTSVLTTHTPFAAFIIPFSPFIAAGNFILAACFYFIMKKSKAAAVAVAAVAKFVFLLASVNLVLGLMEIPPKLKSAASVMFSWPQLVTALIGGIVAIAVIRSIKSYR